MELKDFRKIEFVFENVTTMSVKKEDVNFIRVNDVPIMMGRTPLRRVTISVKSDAVPSEVSPDMSDWENMSEEDRNMQKKVINRFERYRGYGDIVSVELYKDNDTRQILYPYWSKTGNKDFDDFNLFQYSGYETDERYEFTGNYEISFFVDAKKDYEYVDQSSRFISCCAYPDETLLPYELAFKVYGRRYDSEYYLDSCVLIDTGDQYIPVAVDGSKNVYIKNVWLNDLRPYDEEKVRQCIEFIKSHYNDIYQHINGTLTDQELLFRLDERPKQ